MNTESMKKVFATRIVYVLKRGTDEIVFEDLSNAGRMLVNGNRMSNESAQLVWKERVSAGYKRIY